MRQNWGYYTRLTGEGNGTPPQYSCLENPMNGGAWKAAVHGVTEGRTRLSNFTFTFHFHALEKEMAKHSTVFAWRIPGMGKPSGLPSIGSHRVRHDWSDLAAAATDGIIVPVLQDPTTIELDWDQKEGFCFCFFPCYTSFLMDSVLKQVIRFSVKFQKDWFELNLQMYCFL